MADVFVDGQKNGAAVDKRFSIGPYEASHSHARPLLRHPVNRRSNLTLWLAPTQSASHDPWSNSRGWGVVTDRELLAHVRALTADPRFEPDFRQLADLRDVTDVQVTASTTREMARLNPFGAGARRAVVVTSDVVFGMARMYHILSDESPGELQIFRIVDDALRWLWMADAKAELFWASHKRLRFLCWI